ncbi:MAG: prolipoprotein diacylglyceryl transferase [Planctomycetota bacterium]|jgi:phosphatidylglycerol:prolipoprotein diacylglycerol transferase
MGPIEFPAWDPVLLDLPGPIDVRWYGLMYIVAFLAAQSIFVRLARARFLPIPEQAVGDLVFYAILGTILGGRFGYALFYDQGLADPLRLIRVWEGGLSFHGGLIGVVVAMAWFARKHGLPIGRVVDAAGLAVTPGVFAVRIANFINGELYGRITTADTPLAMQFPTDEKARTLLMLDYVGHKRDEELAVQYAYGHVGWEDIESSLHQQSPYGREIPWSAIRERLDAWDTLRAEVPYRHPSQLYEAAGEGLLMGIVLFVAYRLTRTRPLGPWGYGGIFALGYGVVRFGIEYLRQPDSQFRDADDPVGTVLLGMTMGQTLCVAMMLAGTAAILFGLRHRAVAQTGESRA